MKEKLEKVSDCKWRIPKTARDRMRVDAVVYGSQKIIDQAEDAAIEQLTNVACLPGIMEPVAGMPDIHWGYGLPMGAVGAFDAEEGVISAGCTGFDINCLPAGTKVLHEFGYRKNIESFEETFTKDRIKCLNPTSKLKNTEIALFLKKKQKTVIELVTKAGHKIQATKDHPFFTRMGMRELRYIAEGESVSVFPFQGVEYEKPASGIIIEHEQVGASVRKELEQKHLLPLTHDNEKLPYLLKLMGFITGDGCVYCSKGHFFVCFYGEKEDLEVIREDVKRLGFKPGVISSRNRKHNIKTSYGNVVFEHLENTFRVSSKALYVLLETLGLTTGNKVRKEMLVPAWVLKCPKWQKRLYLATLFGAELTTPSTVTKHGYNFYGQVLSMNKEKGLLANGKRFMKQVQDLLKEFGIKSTLLKERKEYVNKEGIESYRLRLQISATSDNLLRLWSTIGFEYNKEKMFKANAALQYLKLKQIIISERERAQDQIRKMKKQHKPFKETLSLKSEYVNQRFLQRSYYEKSGMPRVTHKFETFEEFLKNSTEGLGKTGQVWDAIVKMREIPHNGLVYDFTVADENHNFIANNFMVSNCGIHMIRTDLTAKEVTPKLDELVETLFTKVPCGVGSESKLRITGDEFDEVLTTGAVWAKENGFATEDDIKHMEEEGRMDGADPSKISDTARKRGRSQMGTLGAGNHFLEVQKVDDIYDKKAAKAFGVESKDQAIIMLHCGSRGFGHQVATDYLKIHEKAAKKYDIWLPDPQLVCAPTTSPEGQAYFKAMKCAVNYAFCNRTVMTHWVRESFAQVFKQDWESLGMKTIYDVAHNICKLEKHKIGGETRELYVHRKGATRSLPAGHELVPDTYRQVGQPVLIAGSMGTASHILVGAEKAAESFYSSCHGAGRTMSRHAAIREFWGEDVRKKLAEKGIKAKSTHPKVLSEEAPEAYKDVDEVIESVHCAGLSSKVVRVTPMGVVKG
ncbi:MAG: intein-containing RctB family protein [Candidatus Diapherotrites archaeon]|nr:intein-containing RctB family protein [Candidatus Diapherotrites archaeon]